MFSFHFYLLLQTCSSIYESLQSGDYGTIEDAVVEKYRNECHKLWPQADLFQTNPTPPSYTSCDSHTNGSENSTTASPNQN